MAIASKITINGRGRVQGPRAAATVATQGGAALLMLLLLLVLTSSAFLIERAESSAYAVQKRLTKSTRALAAAKAALIAYAVHDASRPGSLPCPDVDYDGQSTLPDYSGPDCTNRLGWFPHQTLDMQELRDDSGAKLWYAVADGYRANLPAPGVLNSETAGTLSVDATTDVVAVVLAPGLAFTAQSRPGENDAHDASIDLVQFLEDVNADIDLDSYVTSATGDFNDRVMLITRAELMGEVEKRVVGEAAGRLRAVYDSFSAAPIRYFPWPAPFANPRTMSNAQFKSVPGTTEGLLPAYARPAGSFATTFRVAWSGFTSSGPSAASVTVAGPTMPEADVTDGPPGGVAIAASDSGGDGDCVWSTADRAQCTGSWDWNGFYTAPDYSGFPVVSSKRTYSFNIDFVGAVLPSPPQATSIRTRAVDVTGATVGAGSTWTIDDEVVILVGGTPFIVNSGNGILTTLAATAGSLNVAEIEYPFEAPSELPAWFIANEWHHLVYYTVSADYLGGGAGNCVSSANCLALEVLAATTVATDVGIAVLAAGAEIGAQNRTSPGNLAQYFEDPDVAGNTLGTTVSFRPRGDPANNDRVRIVQAGAL